MHCGLLMRCCASITTCVAEPIFTFAAVGRSYNMWGRFDGPGGRPPGGGGGPDGFGDPVVLGVHPKLPWWTGEGGASQLIKYQQRIEMHMAGPARHLGHPRGNAGVPREKPRVPGRHCAQRANGRRRRRFVTRNLSRRGADIFFLYVTIVMAKSALRASLAQLVEHALRKRMVMVSIPIWGLHVDSQRLASTPSRTKRNQTGQNQHAEPNEP